MIYKYNTRNIVCFQNKSRASYSKIRYGELLDKVSELAEQEDKKIWNYYEIDGNICKIYYWDQKNNKVVIILIDADDKDKVVYNYYWQLNCNGYPQSRTNGSKTYLHNLITNNKSNKVVDHLNHNILDNRKENLRICETISDNAVNRIYNPRNTSGHMGVWFDKKRRTQPWRGRVVYKYKEYQKYFDTYDEACKWVDDIRSKFINNQKTFND